MKKGFSKYAVSTINYEFLSLSLQRRSRRTVMAAAAEDLSYSVLCASCSSLLHLTLLIKLTRATR